jgi:putative ribosome biogenesis GTPase RsgA
MKVVDGMKKIEARAGESWIPVLYMLELARDRGEEAYAEINGETFYSKGFDIDEAYKILTGFDRPRDARSVAKDLESWVERGKKLIYPERFEEWINFIIAQSKKESDYGYNIGRVLKLMEMLDKAAVTYQIVLTKIDKIGTDALKKVTEETQEIIKHHAAAYINILATSSEKKRGLEELRAEIAFLAE